MSDPLSIAAGVIGIITAATQISSLLIDFTRQTRAAPRQAAIVLTEITDTSGVLLHLQSLLLDAEAGDQSQRCFLQIDHVVTIITGCVATFSELEELLDGLKTDRMNVLDCFKTTMQEIRQSVDALSTTINHNYQNTMDKLQVLEFAQAQQTQQKPPTTEDASIDRASTPTVRAHDSAINRFLHGLFSFVFERDLSITRAYKRINFRSSTSSLVSTDVPGTSWSMLSDLSMADVLSQISVFNLAITPAEIYNPSHYGNPLMTHLPLLYLLDDGAGYHSMFPPSDPIFEALILSGNDIESTLLAKIFKRVFFPSENPLASILATYKIYNMNVAVESHDLYLVTRSTVYFGYPIERPIRACGWLRAQGQKPWFELRQKSKRIPFSDRDERMIGPGPTKYLAIRNESRRHPADQMLGFKFHFSFFEDDF
ncbi:hypothetical protein MMC22_000234 [Lobaria immixta]|nr:hypothetical protein [Lobaria immixta]